MRHEMMGEVDLFGLDEFGNNPGMREAYGAAIGGGVANLAAVALRHKASGMLQKNAELFGALAGVAAAGALWMGGAKTRASAWAALAAAATGPGLRALAEMLLGPAPGLGLPQVSYLNGLGIPQVDYLNGLGVPAIANVPPSYGTIPGVYGADLGQAAVAGPQLGQSPNPPVSLLGEQSPAMQQVSLLGGPQLAGLGSLYGATSIGGGQ